MGFAGAEKMLARLGQVIYWGASGIAVILALVVALSFATGTQNTGAGWYIIGGFALLVWLGGRAAKYVLAGS